MTKQKLVLILLALCLVLSLLLREKPDTTITPAPTITTGSSAASSNQQTGVSTEAAIVRFRNKLTNIEPKLFLSVERTPVAGVARVQVSNVWYASQPYQRRQLTQMMANLWATEMQGETSILHVYDITGHEIAGTKTFGGVWIEEE